jgi:YVTN family beta-propeller protein
MLATALLFMVLQKVVSGGVALELSVARAGDASAPLREGDDLAVELRVTDSASGAPLGGIRPSVWMLRRLGKPAIDGKPCAAKVAAVASGSMFAAADVDLNIYYVLALNTDDTITVVDPRFEFGGSHLLALVQLSGPGEDWLLSADQSRLFVSIPKSGRVAVVDTARWKVVKEIDAGAGPGDLEVQPDGKYVWVATEGGVAAIDAATLEVAKRIDTGRGPHRVAVTGDNRSLLVTNAGDGTVSVITIATLTIAASIPAGKSPVAIAWSPRSEMAYAAGADGVITIIEPRRARAVAKISTHPGIHDIRMSRDGKWGFILNREKNLIQVLDAAANRVVQAGVIAGTPEQVNFTDTLAYITQVKSDDVLMSTLASLGTRGKPIELADFTGGDHPPGQLARSPLAGGIASAAGENAVLVANPADGEIYYYKEGMAAPMGHFSNYGHRPAAVMSLDRSMREQKPGSFRTQTRIARGGVYDVAVFIDAPRVASCFELSVEGDEGRERERRFGRIAIVYLDRPATLPVARDTALRFRMIDVRTNEERHGVADVDALVVENPGGWRVRLRAAPRDDGTYELTINPPVAGLYYVYVESPSLGLRMSNPNILAFDAR